MVRAQGAYCWDVDGNRYLDWAMGNRVIVLGHCYPAVNDAVKRQIDIGVNFTRPGILEYELAEYLVDLLPVAKMVKFGKNGSDVTCAAVKLSRAYTGQEICKCCAEHPFFSINDWFIGTTPMNSGVPDEISGLTLRFSYNDIPALEKTIRTVPRSNCGDYFGAVKKNEVNPRTIIAKVTRTNTPRRNSPHFRRND